MFLTAYWRDAMLDEDARQRELEDFLGSARVDDRGTGRPSIAGVTFADVARAVTGALRGLS